MKRLHVHIAVTDLASSVRFYAALFNAPPTVLKEDYAKWMLDDPRVNFAISARGRTPGLDHLGIQAESDAELQEMHARLEQAALPIAAQLDTACCYAQSDKYWTQDPQGIAWESFHTLADIPLFGAAPAKTTNAACCVPQTVAFTSGAAFASKKTSCC